MNGTAFLYTDIPAQFEPLQCKQRLRPTRTRDYSMKNSIRLFALVAISTLMMTGCQKEDNANNYASSNHTHDVNTIQTKAYEFQVTYTGTGERIASCEYNFGSNCCLINKDDAVLVYTKTSANAAGNYFYWTAQPYVEDGNSYYYRMGETGTWLYLYADAGDGYHWTNNFVKLIKVIVIPHEVYTETSSKGLNYGSYTDVKKYFNL